MSDLDLAAAFASAWSAGGGARPSPEQTAQLGQLYRVAASAQPGLAAREFVVALAGLAPGPDGLAGFLANVRAPEIALAATAASNQGVVSGLEATQALAPVAGPNVPPRYTLVKRLGAGAMGVVWEAEDTQLRRRVALKWVTPSAAGDRGYRERLFREARALAQLHHPNVVAVHDVGEVGNEVYIALELIRGTTARAWLDAKPRTPAEGLAVWRQAAQGLAAVHRAGLVHRDIKPDNVFVADDGRVVVGDFGLATGDSVDATMNLTQTGAVVGTPLYMAPEQLTGEPATQASDTFSLCVCMWEAMCGKRPFEANTLAGLALSMLKTPAIPPAADHPLFAKLQRGLAHDREDRFASVAELLQALEAAPPATPRRGPPRAVLAVGAVAVVGIVALVAWQLGTSSGSTPTASAQPVAAAAPPSQPPPPQPKPAGAPSQPAQSPPAQATWPPPPPPADALDAPPESEWPKRAAKRLEADAYARRSCKEVLDFIAAKHIKLPREPMDPERSNIHVFCFVADGKCDEARALFLKSRAPGSKGDMLEMANHSFDLSFPNCARP